MNKINKNRNLNSTRLESNAIKSESDKENKLKKQSSNKIEELNNKTRNGITRRNAILRKLKESPPINESGMTDKLSDSTNGLKKIPKPLPMKKIPKPLPDLPHSGLSLKVRQSKPLLSVSTTHQPLPQIHSQVQVQSQPQPRLNFKEIPIKNLPVTEMNKQIESFKNATEREGSTVTNLLVEKLNYHLSQEKNSGKKSEEISAQICKTFAKYGQKAAGYKYNPKQEIKEELVKFSFAWLTMKIEKKDISLTSWDDAIDNMAMSVFNKSKDWGMEF